MCTSVLLFLLIDFLFFQFVLIFVFLAFLRMRKKNTKFGGKIGGNRGKGGNRIKTYYIKKL